MLKRLVYGPGGRFQPDGKPHIRLESQRLSAVLWRAYKGWRRRKRVVPF